MKWRTALTAASVLFVAAPAALTAQDVLWSRTYGGAQPDGAYAIEGTADEGYILAGFTRSFGGSNDEIYLIKTDAAGTQSWFRILGGGLLDDIGRSVRQTPDGGYVIAGMKEIAPYVNDAFLIRTDAAGSPLWQRFYNLGDDERAHSVWETSDGGFILAGQAWRFNGSFGSYDVWVIKTDGSGNVEWQRTYAREPHGNDVGLSIQEMPDGGFIIAGFTQSSAWNAYVIRTDRLGTPLWERTYGGGFVAESYSVDQTSDGGLILAGTLVSPLSAADLLILKTDASGNEIWTKVYGGESDDLGQSVRETADGGFVVTGVTASFGAGGWDVYVLRTDAAGDTLWTRTFGGAADDRGWSVRPTADGEIVVAGWSSFGAVWGDVYLLKLDDRTAASIEGPPGSRPGPAVLAPRIRPNPFNPSTRIEFELPGRSPVALRLYDTSGRGVRKLAGGVLERGPHSVAWDGRDDRGRPVAAGIYVCGLEAGGRAVTSKLVLLK